MGQLRSYDNDGARRFLAIQKRAAELDPDAFKGVPIPQFTTEQQARQGIAIEKAVAEFEKVKDFL